LAIRGIHDGMTIETQTFRKDGPINLIILKAVLTGTLQKNDGPHLYDQNPQLSGIDIIADVGMRSRRLHHGLLGMQWPRHHHIRVVLTDFHWSHRLLVPRDLKKSRR
jgi:hypothetical protein